LGLLWMFFSHMPWILANLCPHPPFINRALYPSLKHTLPYSHSFSLVLSSFLFYISSLILGLFIYSFFKSYFASFEILGNSEKFLLYPRGLMQYTADKSLRAVNLHPSGSLFGSWFFQLLQHKHGIGIIPLYASLN